VKTFLALFLLAAFNGEAQRSSPPEPAERLLHRSYSDTR
jgi:hypothetical protein